MKNFPQTIFLVAITCAALAGCANNQFTRTGTRAPDSAAEQLCGGGPAQPANSRSAASKAEQDRNFCRQQMQGEDMHG